jgi:hypothetical protein
MNTVTPTSIVRRNQLPAYYYTNQRIVRARIILKSDIFAGSRLGTNEAQTYPP